MNFFATISPQTANIITFSAQIFLGSLVVIVSLVNLSLSLGDENRWTLLLTTTLGYIMPSPKIKNYENNNNYNNNHRYSKEDNRRDKKQIENDNNENASITGKISEND